ncbi:MAG: polyprenyl synthetase family protein [Bacillota bacterium]
MFWDNFPVMKRELDQFENYLQECLDSKQLLVKEAIVNLAKAGGKRVRPALIIATARLGDYQQQQVWNLAAAVEILHMATLVHDDIVDESSLRRGTETVQAKHGKDVAVFTGDYLFSLAFNILSDQATRQQLKKVAEIINKICEGEIQQYQDRYKYSLSYKGYYQRIKRKTALLFEGSCALGAGAAGFDKLEIKRLAHYGRYLGMAFQLTDDILDFREETDNLGKPNTNDFTQGIYTMPILYILKEKEKGTVLKKFLENPQINNRKIKQIVAENGGLEYALEIARRYIVKARKKLRKFPDNNYKEVLRGLTNEVIDRNF